MIRKGLRIFAVVFVFWFFIYWGSFLGLGYVIGYVLLAYVLVRAAPAVWSDARSLFAFTGALASRGIDARKSPNNGF